MIQKTLLTLLVLSFQFAGADPVKDFEIERYMGQWYELASIPQFFQRNCARNTTAQYTLLDNGQVKVLNSCESEEKELIEAEGRARLQKGAEYASELEVTFLKLIRWIWAASGEYIVKYIDTDYSVALTGDSKNKTGWILSRNATLSLEDYVFLEKELKSLNYDTCEFLLSETPMQAFAERPRLCDYVNQ